MKGQMRMALLVGCVLALLALPARAPAVSLQQVANFSAPTFVTSPPGDPRLFVVERAGRIQVVTTTGVHQFLDIHQLTTIDGERGLLSMAFDPNYATNGLFYVFYTGDGPNSGGALGDVHVDEYRVSSNRDLADPASRRPVMTISHSSASNHNGGQLQFGTDGLLYISVGEAGNGANAQTLGNALGKILRIDPHGIGAGAHAVPASNPFVGTPGATQEIWSLGLRNPFRFSFDHLTGDLVIGDVGAGAFEEVDFAPTSSGLARGANFGWPSCEGFSGSCPGATAPVFAYPHSDPGGNQAFGCAIIGGYVYRGTQIPELAGRYLYVDLCTGQLRSIQLGLPLAGADRAESAPDALNLPTSFGEDSSCGLYVTTTNSVQKIVGSGSQAAPACPATVVCKAKKKHKKKHRSAQEAKKKKKHKKKSCKKKKKKKRKKRT